MSKRREIIQDVIKTINTIKKPKIGKIVGKAEDITRLARTAFPHVRVSIESETTEDISMDHRLATMTVSLQVSYMGSEKGEGAEDKLSALVEAIEEKLELDRKRDGHAQTTELIDVSEISVLASPIVQSTMTYNIQYTYNRGNR
jgi:hypothetical protein